ncbi:MAG TPA: hypothetical protein VNX25_03295 [Verrucomicrobiae bacterium]|nr:hypothetical protein [Verrucomicrobiae bacterium]
MAEKQTPEKEQNPTAPKGARPYSARRSDTSGGQGQGTHGPDAAGRGKAVKGSDLQKKTKPTKH